jgi:uncharacterized membrane protein YfcA
VALVSAAHSKGGHTS